MSKNNTPKDVFLHLFNIFTFYLSIIAFITLWVQYIEKLFPDAAKSYYYDSITRNFTWSAAVLVIAVPAFILTTWLLEKDIKKIPEKREFKLRKWLLYFTLFLAGITFVVDLITFVMYFFRGELTTRFFLKVLVVLLVAGAVFAYYMWDLKRKDKIGNVLKFLTTILSVVVLGSIVLGFFIIGTPKYQRNLRLDETRTQNLNTISMNISNYWRTNKKLPQNLTELTTYLPTDPETKKSYEYNVKSDLSFELCAEFNTKLTVKDIEARQENYPYYSSDLYLNYQTWEHNTGHTCFERTINPDELNNEMYLKNDISL